VTNYNEMTAAQCADCLAERERWEPFGGGWRREHPERREYEYRDTHPFALTLDAAAGALREPWRWDRVDWMTANVETTIRHKHGGFMYAEGPDELTARYRAAVAARMEATDGQ
jgi:hypothetical protein